MFRKLITTPYTSFVSSSNARPVLVTPGAMGTPPWPPTVDWSPTAITVPVVGVKVPRGLSYPLDEELGFIEGGA